MESETKPAGLALMSVEELRELWDKADNKGGRAGGYSQGEISEALTTKLSDLSQETPVRPSLIKSRRHLHQPKRLKRTNDPSDFSSGMGPVTRRGDIIERSRQ